MCGINGIYAYSSAAPRVDREELLRTRDSMSLRGPDGAGLWLSDDGRTGLAHRRLAIIDLSESGAQPMVSTDGTLVVSFNGEIYNYRELRKVLEADGVRFRTHSDTEVLLHLYRRDGAAMVERLRGMFAFALWDVREKTLFLARDPHGIKPLYYADDGRTLRFASQVSALKAGGSVDLAPDPGGAVGFLLWGSVPEPFTLYRGIRLLPAGHTLTVSQGGAHAPRRYWSLADAIRESRNIDIPKGEAKTYLREKLLDSIRAHMVADVPVGAFLSAGLDSSTVVGLAREVGGRHIQTLTLSFDKFRGSHNDECPLASRIAKHLEVNHQCIVLPSDEQEAELDRFFAAMDQPTIDGINTWFISLAAREAGLKVALSGLGGDELLGGYATFSSVPEIRSQAARIRYRPLAHLYRLAYEALAKPLNLTPNWAGLFAMGHEPEGAYQLAKGVFMPWELPRVMNRDVLEEGLNAVAVADAATACDTIVCSDFEAIICLESVRYMRNQLLRDTDWVSMSHSLEIRVPLVDRHLSESVIGPAAAGRFGPGKSLLHHTVSCGLPTEATQRPKTGFITPTWQWLRHHPGLDIWKRVPLLRQKNITDPRRWTYTLLARVPNMASFFQKTMS